MPGKIFISYRRRDDPGGAGRLFDALNEAFEPDRLFLDVDSIEPGQDFVEVIEDRVAKSAILLAVIGQHWIDATDDRGNRRLDNAQDYVRIEIESALKQKTRVIPVLIGDAKMPAADSLPESIRKLARHNAVVLRYERFHDDMANLTKALKRALGDDTLPAPAQVQPVGLYAPTAAPAPPQDKQSSAFLEKLLQVRVPLLACIVVAVLAGGAYFYFEPDAPSDGTVYTPSSVPGPVASVVPAPSVAPPPGPAPGPPPTPPKVTPVAINTPVAVNTPVAPPAPGVKPDWCSEDHLKPDELTICATQSLWGFDKQLNEVFRKYAATVADQKALSDDEAKWVRETRRPCGTDADCIMKAYLVRTAYFDVMLLRK
jgi:hypothetical protein